MQEIHRCHYCGHRLTKKNKTVDHVIPLCRGGLDRPSNKVKCCATCNGEKGHLTLDEYRAVWAYRSNPTSEGFYVPFYGEEHGK